jgi:methylated-DNA-[protein]-cysteine S-methyltransferase
MMSMPKTIWVGALEGSPLGPVWVAASDRGLLAVEIQARQEDFVRGLGRRLGADFLQDTQPLQPVLCQIGEYLGGERQLFNLQIDWTTLRPFQRQVLRIVTAIPYGRTSTYGAIARKIGRPRAARAVGRANATNPMALVVPCHRVVGSDGSLRGYGAPGGIDTKAWLLALERDGHADHT